MSVSYLVFLDSTRRFFNSLSTLLAWTPTLYTPFSHSDLKEALYSKFGMEVSPTYA